MVWGSKFGTTLGSTLEVSASAVRGDQLRSKCWLKNGGTCGEFE